MNWFMLGEIKINTDISFIEGSSIILLKLQIFSVYDFSIQHMAER
jgi:hypothetical protein